MFIFAVSDEVENLNMALSITTYWRKSVVNHGADTFLVAVLQLLGCVLRGKIRDLACDANML